MTCDPVSEQIGASYTGINVIYDVFGGDEAFGQAFTVDSPKTCLRRLAVKWKYGDGSPIIVEIVPNLSQLDRWGLTKELPAKKPQSGQAFGSWEIPSHSGTPGQMFESVIQTELTLTPGTKYWIIMSPKIGASGVSINFLGVGGTGSGTFSYYAYMYHWGSQPFLWAAIENHQMYFITYVALESCVPNWQCETPLNGYENDGCGNRRLNTACNPICDLPSCDYNVI